jgi:hypothetical protein
MFSGVQLIEGLRNLAYAIRGPEYRPRCTGSARFGIEPHEAPISEFPRQPSRKDGLGTMCTEHGRAYVKGLREARVAGEGSDGTVATSGRGPTLSS